jgi:hypothetical protein
VSIPRIVERSIIVLKKPCGRKQYFLTLPKDYASKLENMNIARVFIIYDWGLGVFPRDPRVTREHLLSFLSTQMELRRFFNERRGIDA